MHLVDPNYGYCNIYIYSHVCHTVYVHERHTVLCTSTCSVSVLQGGSGSTQSESMGTSTQMMDIDSMTSQVSYTLDTLHPVVWQNKPPMFSHTLLTRVPVCCMRESPT